jgi:hypothetical protein
LQEWMRHLVMRVGGCGDGGSVDKLGELFDRFRCRSAISLRHRLCPCRIEIVNCDEFRRRNFSVEPGVITANVADAHDANSKFFHR